MQNIEFTQQHYDKMLELDEDYGEYPFDALKSLILQGAEVVDRNKGFANLDTTSSEEEMIAVGAFIEFRTAKKLLGEYVEEIDE